MTLFLNTSPQRESSTKYTNKESARKPAKRVIDGNHVEKRFPGGHHLPFFFFFFSRTAPPLSKYKVNNKTVKILFSVRSTQEAKPTLIFHRMWTEFLAFSPLGERNTIILVHWREIQCIVFKF